MLGDMADAEFFQKAVIATLDGALGKITKKTNKLKKALTECKINDENRVLNDAEKKINMLKGSINRCALLTVLEPDRIRTSITFSSPLW